MDGIIAIIIIVVAISKMVSSAKNVKSNAPGQSPARPAVHSEERATKPVVPPQKMASQPIQPTIRPAGPDTAPAGGAFWQQVSEAIREEQKQETPKRTGHEAVGRMPEGVSRECEHGSVGGSMAYAGHQEGRERNAPAVKKPAQQEEAYRPALTAEEMRRAVVMAEILKRPGERMAEQARRWSVR